MQNLERFQNLGFVLDALLFKFLSDLALRILGQTREAVGGMLLVEELGAGHRSSGVKAGHAQNLLTDGDSQAYSGECQWPHIRYVALGLPYPREVR